MKTILIALLWLCTSNFEVASAQTHSMKLTRTDSLLVAMLKQNVHPKVIEAIFRGEADNGTIPIPLMRFMDNDFYGEVLFGHPGQKMRMSFDTSWVDTWVPTITCSATSIACAMRNKYNPNKSPFSKRTINVFNVKIGMTNLTGRVYKDLVHINQVNITDQSFAAVSQIPWLFIYSKFDGIVAMGLQNSSLMTQFITNLRDQGKIQRKVFSFYFNRNPSSPKGGTLVFGGVEPRHYKGNFTYVDLAGGKSSEWMVSITNLTVTTPERRTIELCRDGCYATAVTGGNPIAGPSNDIDDLNKAIKAKELFYGRYVVDCASIQDLPYVTFTIGGRDFKLKGRDYIQKIPIASLATMCLSSFKKNDDPSDKNWYLGGAFMSRYYTTFDMDLGRIGFADAQLKYTNPPPI